MEGIQTRNRSKLIEERIELAKQEAKNIYVDTYLTILKVLYKYTIKKTPQVLSQLEKIVEKTYMFSSFDSSVLAAIKDHIMDHIPPTEQYYRRERLRLPHKNIHNLKDGLEYIIDVLRALGKYSKNNLRYIGKRILDDIYSKAKIYRITPAYKRKIQNLRKGLEYLMIPDVWNNLYETYWDILSGKRLPLDYSYYVWQVNMWADIMDRKLDWETQRMHAQEKAAHDYLRSHVICLLSKPDEYMQHMKAGDLWAFVRGTMQIYP